MKDLLEAVYHTFTKNAGQKKILAPNISHLCIQYVLRKGFGQANST